MPEYRFYSIKLNGHIAGPPAIRDCANDGEAWKEALQLIDGRDIEIWHERRLVGQLTPDDK